MTLNETLATPLFATEIMVPVSSGDHLALLQSVPPHGLAVGQIASDRDRRLVLDLIETGLLRSDMLGSIHLTKCGRLWLRGIEKEL